MEFNGQRIHLETSFLTADLISPNALAAVVCPKTGTNAHRLILCTENALNPQSVREKVWGEWRELYVAELAKSFGLPGSSPKAYAASAVSFLKSRLFESGSKGYFTEFNALKSPGCIIPNLTLECLRLMGRIDRDVNCRFLTEAEPNDGSQKQARSEQPKRYALR